MSDYNIQMHDYNGIGYDNLYPKTKSNMVLDGDTNLETKLKYYINPNLIDNWDFSSVNNIVNQRGVTSVSNGSYGIDRWLGKYSIGADGMTFGAYDDYAIQKFTTQDMQNWDGKQATASILYSDGTLTTGTRIYRASSSNAYNFINGGRIQFNKRTDGSLMLYCNVPASIKAVKFELGTQQTLVHNEGTDVNPLWVLNKHQKYGDELRECQRYFYVTEPIAIGGVYAEKKLDFVVKYPVAMRVTPTTAFIEGNFPLYYNNTLSEVFDASNVSLVAGARNNEYATLRITPTNSFSVGTSVFLDCHLASAQKGKIALSAEL